MADWESLIGDKVLVRFNHAPAWKYIIWNVSPSGKWVELKHPSDVAAIKTIWRRSELLELVDTFPDGVE